VHLDRDDVVHDDADTVHRRVTEIAAIVPALRDDFTIEPLFVRESLHGPLRWTGALPPSLAARMERVRGAAALHEVLAGVGHVEERTGA
jgi:hypothetical protein